jgi:hypothetical protein
MDYKKLTRQQIFLGEVDYSLNDFAKDFRKEAIEVWGQERIDAKNENSVYIALLLIIVLTSQGRSPGLINQIILGRNSKELEENLKTIIEMYKQEIVVLEGLQMKMFIQNLHKFHLCDSMNLRLLNVDFRNWFMKAMEIKD